MLIERRNNIFPSNRFFLGNGQLVDAASAGQRPSLKVIVIKYWYKSVELSEISEHLGVCSYPQMNRMVIVSGTI